MVPRGFPVRSLFLAILPLAFLSCGSPDALLLADPYLIEASGPPAAFRTGIRETGRAAGVSLGLVELPAGDSPFDEVRRLVDDRSPGTVVLGPLFTTLAGELAESYPETDFILAGSYLREFPSQAEPAGNLIVVSFDRTAAYREAGTLFAETLAAEGGPGAVLFFTGTEERRREFAAFLEAYRRNGSDDALILREVTGLRQREEVSAAVKEAQAQNAGLFFLSLSTLNSSAFELLEQGTSLVITERYPGNGPLGRRLLASIHDDFFRALEEGLSRYRRGERGLFTVESTLSSGSGPRR
jgi:hypothetical protein